MKSATRVLISTFGGLVGVMGMEHGIGEALQGSTTPDGIMILSWPESEFFRILGGEPAMTIIPNLLVTGILATLVSLGFLIWAVWFVERKHSGLILLLLALLMLLVGGGIFPPVFGLLVSAGASRIHSPLTWWRKYLPTRGQHFLGSLWPWSFGACLLAWFLMIPGVPLLNYYFGISSDSLIFLILAGMFGFLILSAIAGFARDSRRMDGPMVAD